MSGGFRSIALATLLVVVLTWAAPRPASASVGGTVCSLGSLVSGVVGKVCTLATHAGRVLGAGKKLLGGHLGGALSELTGSGVGRAATTAVGLAAVATAVVGGAKYLLKETVKLIGSSTAPNLNSTWFSAFYWRMAAVSALLTLPFLFAAAIQALIRSDLALLFRASLGYLPLGLLAVGVASPLTMLLLAGSDEMSTIVSSASQNAGSEFLIKASALTGLVTAGTGTMFVGFFVGLLTAAAAITLWVELLIRQAAVYVIVLMLPLFFAAMVWPARRVWAIRSVELLVALILSKFAIVAVLALGGAALGHTLLPGPESMLAGATLVLLAAFSPWALLRLLPLHELASAAVGGLRPSGGQGPIPAIDRADAAADAAEPDPAALTERLRTSGQEAPTYVPADWDQQPRTYAGESGAEASQPAPAAQTSARSDSEQPSSDGEPTAAPAVPVDLDGDGARAGRAGEHEPPSTIHPGGGADENGSTRRRLPEMDRLWQAGNGEWRTLDLGPGEFDSDRPLLESEPVPEPEPSAGGPIAPGGPAPPPAAAGAGGANPDAAPPSDSRPAASPTVEGPLLPPTPEPLHPDDARSPAPDTPSPASDTPSSAPDEEPQ